MDSSARQAAFVHEIGKYQLVAELARGGMGQVYLAVAQGPGGFNKLLAVKELKPELCDDETYVAMFLDEARLAARLIHPNVVQTNEVGSDGKRHWMVMEFLDGRSLHRVARRMAPGGALPIGAHLRVIAEALLGLHHAHELLDFDGEPLGIVHRDVSPLNVFVTFDGQAKVLDFGIAKAADSSLETKTGVLKGRVAYMAPEQAWGPRVDRRADVYSAGVMIWEAAARRRLWRGMTDVQVLAAVVKDGAPLLRSVRPDAPPELEAICARALAKEPDDRYGTAQELFEDLEAHLATRDDAPGMREIGAMVARAFADERARMKEIVEDALARLRAGPRSGVIPTLEAQVSGSTSDGPAREGASSMSRLRAAGSARDEPSRFGPPEDAKVPAKRIAAAAAIAAGLLVVFGLLVAFAVRRGGEPTERATTVALPGTVPEPPAAPALVDVVIRVTPASAQLTLDDVAIGTGSFQATVPKDDRVHHLVATADGYDAKTEDLSFARDVSVDVSLERRASGAPLVALPHRFALPAPKRTPTAPTLDAPPAASAAPEPPTTAPPPPPPPRPDVDPAGGRAPLRPILTANPYGNP